jgi:regulator of CtrA degradation
MAVAATPPFGHGSSRGGTAASEIVQAMTQIKTVQWRADAVADFARSELFERTFQEGMSLVEETAAYLDGIGRQESKLLSRNAALAYAGESMRLTTRLMQVASWLLVQRAVREGDMPPVSACEARYRLGAEARKTKDESDEDLPAVLSILLERSERLYERVRHLDRRMYVEADVDEVPHPVLAQMDRIRTAVAGF